jgi:hypothetical protein
LNLNHSRSECEGEAGAPTKWVEALLPEGATPYGDRREPRK